MRDRRNKIIARLEEQKRLLVDPTYMRAQAAGTQFRTSLGGVPSHFAL